MHVHMSIFAQHCAYLCSSLYITMYEIVTTIMYVHMCTQALLAHSGWLWLERLGPQRGKSSCCLGTPSGWVFASLVLVPRARTEHRGERAGRAARYSFRCLNGASLHSAGGECHAAMRARRGLDLAYPAGTARGMVFRSARGPRPRAALPAPRPG